MSAIDQNDLTQQLTEQSGYNAGLMEVSTLFRTLVKRVSQEWNKRIQGNLSFSQFKIIFRLHCNGPQKVSELAQSLNITSGAVTGAVDKLLSGGYVSRERAEDDRRVVYITLSEPGREMIESVLVEQKEAITDFFGGLPDEDMEHLKRIFTDVLQKIDNRQQEE
ncbi:MarR family winged helix-turn-helix transcriptional regulator [Paenibacillus sp. GCM10023252]|uniref:MarR family winged helix-turn-helix transcriptional regulator n=1 Tax=Paenibacillus sp. GCM10023252 TaxID=3252649 RepID=UPI00361122D6